MKAIQKYKSTYKTNREHGRRVAQSLGYKTTIYDMPKMVALMKRAGIEIEGVQYAPEPQLIAGLGTTTEQNTKQDTIIVA